MDEKRNEVEFVERLRAKDASAFEEMLTLYGEKIHNLALRITRSPEDTEEILQDVCITVFNKVDRFEGKAAFSSWLYRVTVNTAFMKLRKRRQQSSISLDDVAPVVESGWFGERSDLADVNFISSRHELRQALESALEKLPHEYRIIFVLRDVDGLSNQEVGEILNITIPAVKSRLHRSRLMLRKRLQRFYDDYTSADTIYYAKNRGTEHDRLAA